MDDDNKKATKNILENKEEKIKQKKKRYSGKRLTEILELFWLVMHRQH